MRASQSLHGAVGVHQCLVFSRLSLSLFGPLFQRAELEGKRICREKRTSDTRYCKAPRRRCLGRATISGAVLFCPEQTIVHRSVHTRFCARLLSGGRSSILIVHKSETEILVLCRDPSHADFRRDACAFCAHQTQTSCPQFVSLLCLLSQQSFGLSLLHVAQLLAVTALACRLVFAPSFGWA